MIFVKKKAYTLMEIMIIIVIVGMLAAIAIPQYFFVTEKARSAEGVHILGVLLGAQKSYQAENNPDYADDIDKLDVTIPVSSNFDLPPLLINQNDPSLAIAEVQRTGGAYKLGITEEGKILCDDSADPGICQRLGF